MRCAYQLAYDALRKSAASLLEAQGLRATSRGGHVAVQDGVIAQFGSSIRGVKIHGSDPGDLSPTVICPLLMEQ